MVYIEVRPLFPTYLQPARWLLVGRLKKKELTTMLS
jgi:hypothetical protein